MDFGIVKNAMKKKKDSENQYQTLRWAIFY